MRAQLQESVSQHGVVVERVEVRQIGLPTDMQRVMASEAEAGVQARANVAGAKGEQEASRKLVEAGNHSTVTSMHLNYLMAMAKVQTDMAYVCQFPLDIIQAYQCQWEEEEMDEELEEMLKGM